MRLNRLFLLGVLFVALLVILYLRWDNNIIKEVPIRYSFKSSILQQELASLEVGAASLPNLTEPFKLRTPYPLGHDYSKTIVVAASKNDDISWLDEELPTHKKAVYVVDDPNAMLHPPLNKGNEAMIYLSYIIDHWGNLSDISIFIHSHRFSWHNNDLLENDSAMVIKHLVPEYVIRNGYVNLRCQWYPGCPRWLNPHAVSPSEEKMEEQHVRNAWADLFPNRELPKDLAQPCCSQFALSKERIESVSLSDYNRLRNWLLKTRLTDGMSGRVFEYVWQYIWTGAAVICPSQHACYCDGFGICLKSEEEFKDLLRHRYLTRHREWELMGWQLAKGAYDGFIAAKKFSEARRVDLAPQGKMDELRHTINADWIDILYRRDEALANGVDRELRAKTSNRFLDQGDGKVLQG